MAKSGGVTHLFAEFSSLDELSSLLGKSARLKYTCLSVSRKFLALGSNSGGAYIFSRDTLKYLQVVFGDTEASLVVNVSLSPSDQHVAIALSSGHVAVYELNIDKRTKPDRVRYISDHVGHTVTAFTWDTTSSKVFVGDSSGKISIIFVPMKGKNRFTIPSEVIACLESSVYQLEWWMDKLLVSTLTQTHLFNTVKHNYCTIGTKSRDGEYGSCFYVEPSSKCTVIYCARPGSRMWEVDFEGKVLNTHQLKQLLAVPPIPVIRLGNEHFDLVTTPQTGQSVSFYKLFHISQFIITWSSKGLYLFDPINVKVMIWTQSFKGIKDMNVYNNDVYLFLENGSVHRLTLLPIYQLFTVLSSQGLWLLSSSLLLAADQVGMRYAVVKRIKKDLLQNILTGLKIQGKSDIAEKVKASVEDISEGSIDSIEVEEHFMDSAEVKGHTYLPSGMVIVSEGVQVKRVWEKYDPRLQGLHKIETTGTVEIIGTHSQKSVDENDIEFQSNLNQMNFYQEEFIDGITIDSNRYEQIKHSDSFIEGDMKDSNESTSSTLKDNEIVEQDSCKDFGNGSNVSLQNQHIDTQVSTDEIVNPGSSEIKAENSLFAELGNSTHEHQTLPSTQEYDQSKMIYDDENVDELITAHSLYTDSNHPFSSTENALEIDMQTAINDTELMPQQNLIKNWDELISFKLADGAFDVRKDIDNEEDTINLLHNNITKFAHSSDNIKHAVPQCKSPINENRDGPSASGNSNPTLILHSSSNTIDLNESSISTESVTSFSGESIANMSQLSQDVSEMCNVGGVTYAEKLRSEEEILAPYSELEVTGSFGDPDDISKQSNQTFVVTPLSSSLDNTINIMASLNNGSFNGTQPSTHFPQLKHLHIDNSVIAQPVKLSKKKKKKLTDGSRSVSMDVNSGRTNQNIPLRKTLSVEDEKNDQFMQDLDLEMDSISIATISSIEEEESIILPDTLLAAEDVDVREEPVIQTQILEMALTPPDIIGKIPSRKSSTSSHHEERRVELIPPLIDRLAAARGSGSNDDLHQDSLSDSPVSGSGEHFFPGGSPRASLSALKDGLSLKLKTQTKSFIKTFKEKNPLTKSASTPMFPTISPNQPLKDGINHSQDTEQPVEVTVADEPNRVKHLAITAANTTDLYISALDIKKQLGSSAVMSPVVLQGILNKWVIKLNLAMCRYHGELVKAQNEMKWKDKESPTIVYGSGQITVEFENGLRNRLKNDKSPLTASNNGVYLESSTLQEHSNSNSQINGLDSAFVQPASSELTFPSHSSEPIYWTSVVHCDDPFDLPKKHLDLFRTLTTMCFVCGVTGDILSCLNFTEETHYQTFVQAVLPSPVYSKKCVCLMNVLPDSNISSDSNHHLNSSSNLRATFTDKNMQNPSSISPNETSSESSNWYTATTDQNYISQDNNRNYTSFFNDTSLHYKTEGMSETEKEMKAVFCSCKSNSTKWNETEKMKKDVSLALFIRLFFFALDYEKVKQAMENHKMMFVAWTSLVLCSREMGKGDIVSSILAEKQINSAFDYLRSGILPRQSALLGHIYKLFELAPSKASEFCGEMWKTITPLDIVQLCSLCSKPTSVYILKYFKQAMTHLAAVMRPEVFRQLSKHRDVRYILLEALLQPQSTDVFVDAVKSLATQLKAVLPFDWLNMLLSQIASEEERDRIVQLSAKNGCPTVFVKLLMEVDQWQKLLQLIVDLNNINLLKAKHKEDGYIPRNEQEWRFLLKCFHNKWSAQNLSAASQKKTLEVESRKSQNSQEHGLDSWMSSPSFIEEDGYTNDIVKKNVPFTTIEEQAGALPSAVAEIKTEDVSLRYESFSSKPNQDDLSQDTTITWHSLGYLLLEHVGGDAAIDLLMEHLQDPMIVKNCLKAEFLKACYIDFNIKMEQNHVVHDILEKLSVYMWKKKPDFVPPSVFHSIKSEKKLIEQGEGEDFVIQGLFTQLKALKSKDLMSEHLGSQWGQEVNISSVCQCCHISLKSLMSLTNPGIILFPCGHAFHKTCASGPACPVAH